MALYRVPAVSRRRPKLDSILEPDPLPKYTLTDHLWNYLQRYAEKHRAAGNGFGFGLVTGRDIARTLSARYHKDGSEILIAQSRGRNRQRLRFSKNGRAMLRKKRQLRRCGIVGKMQGLSRIRAEVLGNASLW